MEAIISRGRLLGRLLLVHSVKWIVIGSDGFIGRHFCRALPDALPLNRRQLDLCGSHENLNLEGYDFGVIAAGMGNPKTCVENPELSFRCNVIGSLSLGKELLKRGIRPIFFSSDYVFNDDLELRPLNLYGEQKLQLEQEGEEMGALVIRLSKVYGIERGDKTLFDEMAQTLMAGKDVRAAYDLIFSPIYVGDVVKRVIHLATKGEREIANVVGPTFASRLEMANALAQHLGKTDQVRSISLNDLNDGVIRPKRLALKGDFPALTWKDGIKRLLAAYESIPLLVKSAF